MTPVEFLAECRKIAARLQNLDRNAIDLAISELISQNQLMASTVKSMIEYEKQRAYARYISEEDGGRLDAKSEAASLRAGLEHLRLSLKQKLAHGDETHKAWLFDAIDAVFEDKPVPPPYGKKISDVKVHVESFLPTPVLVDLKSAEYSDPESGKIFSCGVHWKEGDAGRHVSTSGKTEQAALDAMLTLPRDVFYPRRDIPGE